jgi:hypothetical protein
MAQEVVHLMTQNYLAIPVPFKTSPEAKAMADLRVASRHTVNANLDPEVL